MKKSFLIVLLMIPAPLDSRHIDFQNPLFLLICARLWKATQIAGSLGGTVWLITTMWRLLRPIKKRGHEASSDIAHAVHGDRAKDLLNVVERLRLLEDFFAQMQQKPQASSPLVHAAYDSIVSEVLSIKQRLESLENFPVQNSDAIHAHPREASPEKVIQDSFDRIEARLAALEESLNHSASPSDEWEEVLNEASRSALIEEAGVPSDNQSTEEQGVGHICDYEKVSEHAYALDARITKVECKLEMFAAPRREERGQYESLREQLLALQKTVRALQEISRSESSSRNSSPSLVRRFSSRNEPADLNQSPVLTRNETVVFSSDPHEGVPVIHTRIGDSAESCNSLEQRLQLMCDVQVRIQKCFDGMQDIHKAQQDQISNLSERMVAMEGGLLQQHTRNTEIEKIRFVLLERLAEAKKLFSIPLEVNSDAVLNQFGYKVMALEGEVQRVVSRLSELETWYLQVTHQNPNLVCNQIE